jgi:AcrR family transcriptional regulator
MTLSTIGEKGWRGSLEGWLDVAYEALVDSGVEAVRILPLAKKLEVSRTSFYWFFKDREALLAALLEQWREKNTGNFRKQAESYAESITEAIFNIFDCWLDPKLFDSKLEFAVRSWAQQSTKVATEIKTADASRLESLTNMFIRFRYGTHAADVRARTIYLTQIGYISMKTKEDLATRMRRIPEYVEIFTGTAALPRELGRFFARHGFVPKQTVPVTTRNNNKKKDRSG